jgi:hypothetical protein
MLAADASGAIKFDAASIQIPVKLDQKDCSCDFKFVNDGSAPLLIKNIKTSCGCTTNGSKGT